MPQKEDEAQEATDTDATASGPDNPEPKAHGGRRATSRLRRELEDTELAQSGVQKMLMADNDRLYQESEELREIRIELANEKLNNANLEGKIKVNTAGEIISSGCAISGSLAIGYAPSLFSIDNWHGYMCLVIGAILIFAGVVSKVIIK